MHSNGCVKYSFAIAKLAFWDGSIRCEVCPCMETYARKQCRLTGEYLVDTRAKGFMCPLIEVEPEVFYEEKGEYYGNSSSDFR